jgi:hypothetical protein
MKRNNEKVYRRAETSSADPAIVSRCARRTSMKCRLNSDGAVCAGIAMRTGTSIVFYKFFTSN